MNTSGSTRYAAPVVEATALLATDTRVLGRRKFGSRRRENAPFHGDIEKTVPHRSPGHDVPVPPCTVVP